MVRVTVLARANDGQVLSDLNIADFKVLDEGASRSVVAFENLRPSQKLLTRRQPEIVSNRPGGVFRVKQPATVLLIDVKNTDPEFQPWLTGQAAKFLSLLRPDEDVAVYQLGQNGLKLLHAFSSDAAGLIRSIFPNEPTGAADRFPVLEPDTANEFAREANDKQLRRRRYESTCRSVAMLASQMAFLSGRKDIFWMSGDFPPLYGTPKKEAVHMDSSVASATAHAIDAAGVAFYPVDVRSPFPPEPFQRISPGNPAAIPARRRRAVSGEMPAIMAGIAAFTGGKSISNRSQLAEALFDAAEETRFAYAIGFRVPDSAWDGRMHGLAITTDMHGAIVTAKHTYFAGDPPMNDRADSDKTAVGLSVHAAAAPDLPGGLQLDIHVDPTDLRWAKAKGGWDADCGVRISRLLSDDVVWVGTKSFQVSDENHARLDHYDLHFSVTVNAETEGQGLRVLVRDLGSLRAGSVTLSPHFEALTRSRGSIPSGTRTRRELQMRVGFHQVGHYVLGR